MPYTKAEPRIAKGVVCADLDDEELIQVSPRLYAKLRKFESGLCLEVLFGGWFTSSAGGFLGGCLTFLWD